MQAVLKLHPSGHECAPGVAGCSFGEAFHGFNAAARKNVTFAFGCVENHVLMLFVDGHVTEQEFRQSGTYDVALLETTTGSPYPKLTDHDAVYHLGCEQLTPEKVRIAIDDDGSVIIGHLPLVKLTAI